MAWNDPGGDNRDPWSGGGGNQGPPDLDELLRKAKERLSSLFGGSGSGGEKGSGSGGGGGLPIGPTGIGVIAGVIVLGWLASGIYIVDEGQRGVELTFGANSGITQPGPHWHYPTPAGSVEQVDVSEVRTVEIGYESMGNSTREVLREALMLTRDENIVNLKVAIQYRVSDPADYLFNHRSPDDTLKQLAESALREVVGKAEAPEGAEIRATDDLDELADELSDELSEEQLASLISGSEDTDDMRPTPLEWVLTQGRAEVAQQTEQLMQDTLDGYEAGFTLIRVAIQDAQPPEQVQPAFADAIRAREDQQRTITRARGYANALLPQAQGQAARIREEAQAYREQVIAEAEGEADRFVALLQEYQQAPAVTEKRLYIETIERVLSESSKIMVDVDGGQPLMYLPLDRILERRGASDDGADEEDADARAGGLSDRPGEGSDRFAPVGQGRDTLRTREVR
ncbi:FtsH protease activity modulator HflK [Arhodomonas sp. SL1]|uniref:FtsH protease activity modulator HflK n=1 Tax=Arhodomonas sp. SL1 TaxID=3425691 RepID=UPI003F8803ED